MQEISSDTQRLIFHGRVLQDDKPLNEFGGYYLIFYTFIDTDFRKFGRTIEK